MGRLFWKLFFIILLGHVTAVGSVNLIAQLYTTSLPPLPVASTQRAGPPDIQSVIDVVAILRSQGLNAVQQKFGSQLPVFIVDQNGHEALGQDVPPGLLDAAKFSRSNNPDAPHVQEVELSGQHYLVFPPMPGQQPASLPTLPANWFMANLGPIVTTSVSLLYAIFLAWYLAKPIRNLRAAFAAVASGNLESNARLNMGKRRDELADLSHDFDRMTEQLRNLLEEKRRLLHDISHELRSPLARLQVAIGLARQQPEKAESTLARIELESSRMDKLIGELLTLSKLETDHHQFTRELLDLDELIGDIVNDASFEAQAQQKQVTLNGRIEAGINGNADLLRRAFENVIRNAIKHTPENSTVSVEVHQSPQQLHVAVLDQGTGVPEDELGKIFEPFFRSNSQSKKRTGFGLGLAITRSVLEAHGGSIQASNRNGGGLRVDIALPIAVS